jgi:hypothetical protein
MRFTIEIVRHDDDGTLKVLHRFISKGMSHAGVKAKAERLLRRACGGDGFRITGYRGEELFNWRQDPKSPRDCQKAQATGLKR